MNQTYSVFIIVGVCVIYLIFRVYWLKSKKTRGCSHGNCDCKIVNQSDLNDK